MPNVFTIPPGAPFLDTLVDALLDGRVVPGFSRDAGPLGLAGATIYLPTRRAARALATTVAARMGATAFLPRIRALGALDEDELFDEAALGTPGDAIPDAVDALTRRMILTRLILAWSRSVKTALVTVDAGGTRQTHGSEAFTVAATAADAWHLSGELARLLDELVVEDVDWSAMKPLGTELFDRYWAITLDFLAIAVEQWPAILADMDLVDPAVRQGRLMTAEIDRLGRLGERSGPVIVVGSTGTNRATNRFMAGIARLPMGAVVLPGLDPDLDDATWDRIDPLRFDPDAAAGHPQAALRRLLPVLGVERAAVVPLGTVPAGLAARARFVSEALRPASTTDAWQRLGPGELDRAAALAGVTLVEAADEREEALALALALREALEGPGTATLVTPDRALARRVRAELTRWDIVVDDSGGAPLSQTSAGGLARLALTAAGDLAPADLLALLAHPSVRLGRTRTALVRLAQDLEVAVLRAVLPTGALHDPQALFAAARAQKAGPHAPRLLRAISDEALQAVEDFLADVLLRFAPLHAGRQPLPAWIAAHEALVVGLAETDSGGSALAGPDAQALLTLFDGLAEAADPAIVLDLAGYAALFDRMAAEMPVRGPERSHPRLKILGLLEARLLSTDRILLGGLDETVWPQPVRQDCFLNRPMRATLDLPPPERAIGQSAHAFTMALGQPEVILSRAKKRGSAPTVPSRFLQRMAALAGTDAWGVCRTRGDTYLAMARVLDTPSKPIVLSRPNPKPAVHLRPQTLSVTRIETLRRDPYAIYADKILRLAPLDAVAAKAGQREWGTLFHGAVERFTQRFPTGPLPAEAADLLLEETRQAFADMSDDPAFRSFMSPRVEGWARAFVEWDQGRRRAGIRIVPEVEGAIDLTLRDGSSFRLRANADRIEVTPDGTVSIVDIKTGRVPTPPVVRVGFAPQLTLEAAMVALSGFEPIGAEARVGEALYLGFPSPGKSKPTPLTWKDRTLAEVVDEHLAGLVALLSDFRDPGRGYLARPYPQFAARHSDYDHLSRVKEWSVNGSEGDEP